MKSVAIVVACFGVADDALRAGERNEGIRARLEQCLPAPGAMACYEQTLWMSAFFAAKKNGVSLERAVRGYPAPFEALIADIYLSDKDEQEFRRDWFVDCIDG